MLFESQNSLRGYEFFATVAQLVEQLICNQLVGGSSPSSGSENFEFYILLFYILRFKNNKTEKQENVKFKTQNAPRGCPGVGEPGQTVTLLLYR